MVLGETVLELLEIHLRTSLCAVRRPTEWPIGIPQELAGEQHQISFFCSDDMIRLYGRRDETDGSRRDHSVASDPLRKGRLVTRTDGNVCPNWTQKAFWFTGWTRLLFELYRYPVNPEFQVEALSCCQNVHNYTVLIPHRRSTTSAGKSYSRIKASVISIEVIEIL